MKINRRLSSLGLVAATATLVLGVAGGASADVPTPTQTVDIALSPTKLPKGPKVKKNVAMTITTTTDETSCDGVACNSYSASPAGSEGPFAVPTPARKAFVSFDPDIAFYPANAKICTNRLIYDPNAPGTTGVTNEQAIAKCPNSVIGGGIAAVKIPSNTSPSYNTVTPQITAFRVPDVGGKPTIILYVYVPQLAGFVQKLQGVLKTSNVRGYGKMLDVTIPPLAASAALTSFSVTVGNGYKPGFIKSSCSDKKTKLSGKFDFWGGWRSVSEANKLSATATSTKTCTN